MGEVLLAAHRPELVVESAGRLTGGMPATPAGVAAMAARGLDLSGHVSRTVTRTMLAESDLIVGMAREHVRDAVLACTEIRSRAFTLGDFVRRGQAIGPRGSDQSLIDWLGEAGIGRTTADLLGSSEVDDIADPIGRSAEHYEACAQRLDSLLGQLADLAFPNSGA